MKDDIPDQIGKEDMWVEGEHVTFGDHGSEPAVNTEAILGRTGVFPKKQWRRGIFSIIEPSEISFGQYELYPINGNDIMRFDTLQEAKNYADNL